MLNRFLFSPPAPHVLRSGMMVVGSDSGRWMNDFYYSNLFQISVSLSLLLINNRLRILSLLSTSSNQPN